MKLPEDTLGQIAQKLRSHKYSASWIYVVKWIAIITAISCIIWFFLLSTYLQHIIENKKHNEVSFEVHSLFISILFAVIGLIFSIRALADSDRQEKEIQGQRREMEKQRKELEKATEHLVEISKSMSTACLGTFPKHLDEITKLVERSHSRLCIMADCVDYGSFSAPSLHESVLQSIKVARGKKPEVKVQILLCGDWQHFSRSSPYFGKKYEDLLTDPELKDAFVACLNNYLAYHPTFRRPSNDKDFIEMLQHYQASVWEQLNAVGVEKHQLDSKLIESQNFPGVFFWMEDDVNAIFLLSHAGVKAQEIAFRTRDARLIEIFKTIFDRHWPKS